MNSFGSIFRVSIYGESHGEGVGVLIDGCPPGVKFSEEDMLEDLARRKAGGAGTTKRIESDYPKIMSGVYNGYTTGAPINIFFNNENTRSKDYSLFKRMPRPGHSDFVAEHKYSGYNDIRGGGHFSGRLTLGLVAAGVLAKKIVADLNGGGIEVKGRLIEAGGVDVREYTGEQMELYMERIQQEGDSIGGVIEFTARNMPIGLGDPFFGSLESVMSQMIFSIPAVKGIEFGAGFDGCKLKGSQHNDRIMDREGHTATNNNGGVNGGISNGNDVVFRVGIKPTSSIFIPQKTYNFEEKRMDELQIKGRHDSCIARRAVVVVENAAAIVLADLMLRARGISKNPFK